MIPTTAELMVPVPIGTTFRTPALFYDAGARASLPWSSRNLMKRKRAVDQAGSTAMLIFNGLLPAKKNKNF